MRSLIPDPRSPAPNPKVSKNKPESACSGRKSAEGPNIGPKSSKPQILIPWPQICEAQLKPSYSTSGQGPKPRPNPQSHTPNPRTMAQSREAQPQTLIPWQHRLMDSDASPGPKSTKSSSKPSDPGRKSWQHRELLDLDARPGTRSSKPSPKASPPGLKTHLF